MDVRKRTHRRRRRTEYDSDDDSSGSEPEYLDEQQQEELIRVLKTEDAKGNRKISNVIMILYTIFLVTVPLYSESRTTAFWTILTTLPQLLTAHSIRYINVAPDVALPSDVFSSNRNSQQLNVRAVSEAFSVRGAGFLAVFGGSLMLGMVHWYRWECWGPLVLACLCAAADFEARSVNVEDLEVRKYGYRGA
ncbi:hypothetical protein BJ508DRAFT_333702 [Ascobolus immersus RN42]|uniref:Uncharacterized protein n=1 Tax=Ascobolus immersus RN42 TaxID=1160509 RepID=A0A3N4HP43_ASCIM|nr:hypothetical protein BJ508DRAFT_333702 [Ascobolus immersus RN42]